MRSEPQAVGRTTRLFSKSAWIVLAFIILGYLSLMPQVTAALEDLGQHAIGRFVLGVMLAGFIIAALLLWGSAIRYARSSPETISRSTTTALLILTNFVGAFFYYWLSVHWRRSTKDALAGQETGSHAPAA